VEVAAGEDHALWLLLLTCASGKGEVLALRWADCDLERGLLHVRRTLTLPLSAPVIAAPHQQRARVLAQCLAHADVWNDRDLVFPTAAGSRRGTLHC
jgi:integrase